MIFLDNVGCLGNETQLNDCFIPNDIGDSNCLHIEDVSILCPCEFLCVIACTRLLVLRTSYVYMYVHNGAVITLQHSNVVKVVYCRIIMYTSLHICIRRWSQVAAKAGCTPDSCPMSCLVARMLLHPFVHCDDVIQ